jgi:hypothetical protein
MSASWLLTGGAVGLLNALTVWWTVNRLRPGLPRSHALAWTLGGAALRWGFVAALLIAALQRGTGPALLAFGGLWLACRLVIFLGS